MAQVIRQGAFAPKAGMVVVAAGQCTIAALCGGNRQGHAVTRRQ